MTNPTDSRGLPVNFPTHLHADRFWEALGRTIGTFGFLEEVLGRAIFAITGTREYPEDEIEEAFEAWLSTLEHALSDPLMGLIEKYGAELKKHPDSKIGYRTDLLEELKASVAIRNALCHSSWQAPDSQGRSTPRYVTKGGDVLTTAIDIEFLDQVREHTVMLVCLVIKTITDMGWQFPGSNGPGKPLMP